MCGICGAACGNASRACHCMSLRAFAFLWLAISILVALFQFVAGAVLSSYLSPVDRILSNIRENIMRTEDPTVALKYYSIIADSLSTLWKGVSLVTTVRGVYDLIALACWVFGWYKRRMIWVYIFIGMMAVDFAVDLLLLFVFLTLFNVFYVAYFYPASSGFFIVIIHVDDQLARRPKLAALLLPFAFYGWQALLGPYILHLLLSHAVFVGLSIFKVMSEGGNGTEMKSWKELSDAKKNSGTKDIEQAPLIDSSEKKTPASAAKEAANGDGGEPTVELVSDDES
ncbi:hypothetical protein Efla_005832 [Eimeria flavescens]